MELIEQSPVPLAALPVMAFRDHLRLGTGFADDGIQDAVLEGFLRAAIATVEGKTAKALIVRSFTLTQTAWRDLAREVFPVAPVQAVTRFAIIDPDGTETLVDPSRYRLIRDGHRPALESTGLLFPTLPVAGRAEIDFDAGFGASWAAVPSDPAQAVFLLGAHFYERRDGSESGGRPLPDAVAALIAPHRNLRLFGGRG
ncbi:MAG: hypothetical protein HKO95_16285 [Rhodobacteraceae bacterium]|nr:hypothetical protein [Alphaproteobacteria bacterium]NNK68284.1 hypothetical protein [Paracoccaceae bacterium]